MSIDDRGARPRTVLALACSLVVSCGGEEPAPNDAASTPDLPVLSAPDVVSAPEPRTVLDIFPEDPARDLVMNNCASCHAVACAAMGQRPVGRWEGLKAIHAEEVPALPETDLDAIFSYLQANFSDAQPEPVIPAAFLEGGCTPF